jgi:PAS domain S-box-containing protein
MGNSSLALSSKNPMQVKKAPLLGRLLGAVSAAPSLAFLLAALVLASASFGAAPFSSPAYALSWGATFLVAGGLFVTGLFGLALRGRSNSPAPSSDPHHAPPTLTGFKAIDASLQELAERAASFEESQRAAEKASQEVIDRQKVLTDNIAAAVILRDSKNALEYCSPYTEVLTGYSRKEIFDHSQDFFLEIVHPEDKERYERALKIGVMGEAFQIRHRLLHKTGIEMWVETRTVPILDDDGEVSQSLSVMLDVTGAVRYQKQVEEKNRDLHDFAYMVSHDLKGPIVTIKGMLGIFEEDLRSSLSKEAEETLRHIRGATQKLEQLVASVLEYSKISSLDERSEPVELATVLKELLQHLSPQLSSSGASITIEGTPPTVIGEHVWLYQVFSNLLGNAIKYREPARPLRVQVSFSPQSSGREVVVQIADNGLGIPKDKISQLFRPFQRAHSKDIEGTGIGLASVKRVLEKCGGSVRVESTEGVGSVFFVTLRAAR